jgi:hypothetical protein
MVSRMVTAPTTEDLVTPRRVQIEYGGLSLADWSSFHQRVIGILRQSIDPKKCLSLMRIKARGLLELDFGEIKEGLALKMGVEEPARPEILPLNVVQWHEGIIEEEGDTVNHLRLMSKLQYYYA